MADEQSQTDERAEQGISWIRYPLLFVVVAGAAWSGFRVCVNPYDVATFGYLIAPILLLPIVGYLCLDSIRQLGRPAPPTSRTGMIPWSLFCALVVLVGFFLLFSDPDSIAGFVYAAVFATASFYSVLLAGSWHSASGEWAAVVFFVIEWAAIWSVGMVRLWQRKRLLWTGLLAAHFGLGFLAHVVFGLPYALGGGTPL